VGMLLSTSAYSTSELPRASALVMTCRPHVPLVSHVHTTLLRNLGAQHGHDISVATASTCAARRSGHIMLTADSGALDDGATGMTEEAKYSGRVMRWTADAMSTARCTGPISAYLKGLQSAPDLIERVDASVFESLPIDSPSQGMGSAGGVPQRYRVSITPLRFPGLEVAPSAIMRVDPMPTGLRITTERCENKYSGMYGRIFGAVQPEITSCTELRAMADDGCELVAESRFMLTLPLPGWWPIPTRAMDAGRVLIQRIVEQDTRLAVTRIKAEFEASRI